MVRIHVLFAGHEIMRRHDGVAVAQVLKGRMRVYVRKARVENGDAETATVVAALQERFRTKPLRLVLRQRDELLPAAVRMFPLPLLRMFAARHRLE